VGRERGGGGELRVEVPILAHNATERGEAGSPNGGKKEVFNTGGALDGGGGAFRTLREKGGKKKGGRGEAVR